MLKPEPERIEAFWNTVQYDNILFIELQVQYMKIPSSEHGENMLCTEIDFDIQNNLCTQHVFPCSAKIRASDKDLPVS